MQTPDPKPVYVEPAQIKVLTAGRAIGAGETIQPADLRWTDWPADAAPDGAIHRQPETAPKAFQPAMARFPLIKGEPLSETKLIRAGEGSAMAALIGPGKRAVAVPVREESAAGGLIQPNDRVDVIWTPGRGDRATGPQKSRILLRGAKILAIGQSLAADRPSGKDRTATLELTPDQAQLLASARQSGDISLALLPASDIAGLDTEIGAAPWRDEPEKGIRILKFGR